MQKKEQIQRLYKKFLDNECSRKEFDTLLDLVKNMDDKEEMSRLTYGILKAERARQAPRKTFSSGHKDRVFKQAMAGEGGRNTPVLPTYRKNYSWYKVAAVLLLVTTLTFLIYQFQHPGWLDSKTQVAYLERVTFPGQKTSILLSDGSRVQLNSSSKLVYEERFGPNFRELTLEGEAFFEVAPDPQRPFIIKSGKLVTTVLGTSFNIKAYPEDQKIEVAVATGKVTVTGAENGSATSHLLTPNSLATYDLSSDKINVESVDIQEFISWKEGVLTFNDARFEEVVKTLEKWYGVEIIFDSQIGDCIIFGEFENQSLSNVLRVLGRAVDIEHEFTAEGVKITGGGCAR